MTDGSQHSVPCRDPRVRTVISAHVRPAIGTGIAWAVVGEEVVILDRSDAVHVISSTGALLWQLLDGTATVAELAADVAAVFERPSDVAIAEVSSFVGDAMRRDLVVDASVGDAPAHEQSR